MNTKRVKNSPDTEIEKLDLRSHDIAGEKTAQLLTLFPEIRTEGGKIDFDQLKRVLGETVDPGKERYGMNWPGKADCFKTIQQPTLATLRPCPEESVNFDTTENLIIEGDNLEVLKLLQKSYIGKIKMIYIDPPYNTGSDFIYPDNYSESLQTYLEYTNQVDGEGKKFSTNTDTDGRFHSKWLNMMYPRLYLAKNLLREDGVIFISIDDHEVDNLTRLCDEVFGQENRIAIICHKARASVSNDKIISSNHNFILLYAKNIESIFQQRHLFGLPPDLSDFKMEDSRGKFRYAPVDGPGGASKGNPHYTFLDVTGYFRFSKERMSRMHAEGLIVKIGNGLQQKYYLEDAKKSRKTHTTWWDDKLYTSTASSRLKELLGVDVFDSPKPVELIVRMLELSARDEGSIILDFFAGSGTTAHAVLECGKLDNIKRNFILIQLPEPCSPTSDAGRAGFQSIADITKERVRRVITKLQLNKSGSSESSKKPDRLVDLGFKVFKLDGSNFAPWRTDLPTGDTPALAKQLELHISHLRPGRTSSDILYEILLKSGFPLTTKVETLKLSGKEVYSIADGSMLLCLEESLTHDVIKAMADLKPERVICLDESFAGNDQLKTNAVQTMKARGVTSFKTV